MSVRCEQFSDLTCITIEGTRDWRTIITAIDDAVAISNFNDAAKNTINDIGANLTHGRVSLVNGGEIGVATTALHISSCIDPGIFDIRRRLQRSEATSLLARIVEVAPDFLPTHQST